MNTFHIHITGIVQGVGFRPMVYKHATIHHIKGWVNNSMDGVHIRFNAKNHESANLFLDTIKKNAPLKAVITDINIRTVEKKIFHEFEIKTSSEQHFSKLLLTPDYAMCNTCKEELYQVDDRRYHYPFITCTDCGPRYSIIRSLPYDRPKTTMDSFVMCEDCRKEYENPLDRRYFAQTNSCPNCKISLSLWEPNNTNTSFTDLAYIIEQWKEGKIIAIKGIGGYLLTCDASNSNAIKRLRRLKNRPSKPFALMYHNIYELAEDTEMDIFEKLELESSEAPIVILNIKKDMMTPLALKEICPNLDQLGIMMPYTPLFDLLLSEFKKPIIATSGNPSNGTIVYEDKKAIKELLHIADIILSNNREIVIPQDDSVIKYTTVKYQKIILRRSRGLSPSYIDTKLSLPKIDILCMGAMKKSAFALLHQSDLFISQYIGNTDNMESQENYKNTLKHMMGIITPNIETILIDKHPGYFTNLYGRTLAKKKNIPFVSIQHHKAHFYAILGEHNLIDKDHKVLGVIWDGTGLGDDNQIWGGEFFEYNEHKVTRVHHIPYFDFILGDKMPKEPRISALACTHQLDHSNEIIKSKFTNQEWNIYQTILKQPIRLKTSSMGRIFDGVASILLDINKQSYEGEAAMQLENAAYKYFRENGLTRFYTYIIDDKLPSNLTTFIFENIIRDKLKGYDVNFIAAKFHVTLSQYIYIYAKKNKYTHVAFSGGVFQNGWLVDLIISYMDSEFSLYFHNNLSPNDENIAFGQLMYYLYDKG